MEKSEMQKQMEKDVIMGIGIHYKELSEILKPINFTPRKYSEEVTFVRSGGVGKMFDQLNKIMLGINYIIEGIERDNETNK